MKDLAGVCRRRGAPFAEQILYERLFRVHVLDDVLLDATLADRVQEDCRRGLALHRGVSPVQRGVEFLTEQRKHRLDGLEEQRRLVLQGQETGIFEHPQGIEIGPAAGSGPDLWPAGALVKNDLEAVADLAQDALLRDVHVEHQRCEEHVLCAVAPGRAVVRTYVRETVDVQGAHIPVLPRRPGEIVHEVLGEMCFVILENRTSGEVLTEEPAVFVGSTIVDQLVQRHGVGIIVHVQK